MPDDGLILALELDGKGGRRVVGWEELRRPPASERAVWGQLERSHPAVREFLEQDPDVPENALDALLDDRARPRCVRMDGGVLLVLRAVNLNPGAEPDDMASVRVWATPERVLTLRTQRVYALQDISEELERGQGPANVSEFLVLLPEKVQERADPLLHDLQEREDELEEQSFEAAPVLVQERVSELQRELISIHRHLAPQRLALIELARLPGNWLDEDQRGRVGETIEHLTRYLEDVQVLRDRTTVSRDQLAARLSSDLNRRLYILALLTALFMPLTLVTGVLGINVAGIPGADDEKAFLVVCALLVLVFVAQWFAFRWRRWL